MATAKASNAVLNLVNPPIDEMVLLSGSFDDVVIGSHVPSSAVFTSVTDTSLASPLVGAPNGALTQVFLGTGLAMSGNVLYLNVDLYGIGLYGTRLYSRASS